MNLESAKFQVKNGRDVYSKQEVMNLLQSIHIDKMDRQDIENKLDDLCFDDIDEYCEPEYKLNGSEVYVSDYNFDTVIYMEDAINRVVEALTFDD